MAKTIIKEIIIMLLLCLAIILILGVLLYEYVPNNKVLPDKVAYTTPEDVKKEILENSSVDENQVILTYEIDSTDLNNYQRIKDYKPGKPNPFSSYETSGETGTANSGTGTSGTTSSGSTTNKDTGYFQNKGTK